MSTVEHAQTKILLPPLVAGQQLDQPTFHERYEAMPEGTWAELVGGRVYMPSPVRNEHGEYDEDVALWTGLYKKATKGITERQERDGHPGSVRRDPARRSPADSRRRSAARPESNRATSSVLPSW